MGDESGANGQECLHCLPLPVYHTSLPTLSSKERTADTSCLCGKTPCSLNLRITPNRHAWLSLICFEMPFMPGHCCSFSLTKFPLSATLLSFSKHVTREVVILHICLGTAGSLEDILRSRSIQELYFFQDPLSVSEADCPLIFGD